VTDCKKVENFFELQAKASKELEEAVAEELRVEDPPAEQAEAVLKQGEASSGPEDN
jgi:hypothetical protein